MQYPKNTYYKYRPLYSDENNKTPHKFTQSIVESAELFYATPSSFNDPFDSNFKLHADDSTDADWERYIDALIEQYPEQRNKFLTVKTGKLWNSSPELNCFGQDTQKKHYEDSSVLCLSKKSNSIPMFSYYANDHRGIAIEFQFSDIEIPCGILIGDINNTETLYQRKVIVNEVEYLPKFPELNYHRLYNSPQLVTSLMFTKFDEWKHEQEFRIFRSGVLASIVNFPKSILTKIIFGIRTSDKDVTLVKQWLANHPTEVILSKAEISLNTFELNIHDFEKLKP